MRKLFTIRDISAFSTSQHVGDMVSNVSFQSPFLLSITVGIAALRISWVM